ncbi:MAG TPA: hypothetical protein PLM07_02735 [Candidatus Rifleibacterium sp.]|nr:hypothetical protein [Candidatus Rifleibacterium sp.]HPT44800.1 hypothetical protein [Candidatus Rifleibacterium sp.]
MRRLSFSGSLLLMLLLVFFMPVAAQAQTVATSSELTPAFLRGSDTIPLPPVVIPDPVSGKGRLSITIETFSGENPKRVAQHAIRAELWLGDHRIASLNEDEENVSSEKDRRIFNFPEIEMAYGYYFITVRLYSRGDLHGRRKSHEQTFQVGIHPGRISRVYKKMPFFHW